MKQSYKLNTNIHNFLKEKGIPKINVTNSVAHEGDAINDKKKNIPPANELGYKCGDFSAHHNLIAIADDKYQLLILPRTMGTDNIEKILEAGGFNKKEGLAVPYSSGEYPVSKDILEFVQNHVINKRDNSESEVKTPQQTESAFAAPTPNK